MFKKSLENDVKGDTSGTFRNVLVSLLNAQRPNDTMIDRTQAQQDAQMLVTANKDKKFSPDKVKFILKSINKINLFSFFFQIQ